MARDELASLAAFEDALHVLVSGAGVFLQSILDNWNLTGPERFSGRSNTTSPQRRQGRLPGCSRGSRTRWPGAMTGHAHQPGPACDLHRRRVHRRSSQITRPLGPPSRCWRSGRPKLQRPPCVRLSYTRDPPLAAGWLRPDAEGEDAQADHDDLRGASSFRGCTMKALRC